MRKLVNRIASITICFVFLFQIGAFAERKDASGWDLNATGAAWYSQVLASIGRTREVRVAVIDTGFTSNASIFNGRILEGYNSSGKNHDVTDTDGHGTAMASIIAYTTFYNSNIKIMPIKIDFNGDIAAQAFQEGIEYATRQGVDIINISIAADIRMGSAYVIEIEKAIREAVSSGIIVVVASGNDGKDASGWSPARMNETVCIGSVNQKNVISSFSNYGNSLRFVAPGESVITTRPDADYHETGTSSAAAHISGIYALMKLNFPSASPAQLEHLLKLYATDLGEPGWDKYYGWGLPNLAITPADTGLGSRDINNYLDMRGHWSRDAVSYLAERSILNGYLYLDNLYEFMPLGEITRAEFAAMLSRASGDTISGRHYEISDIPSNDWFTQSTYWAYEKGIVKGYDDGEFKPHQNINRQEMAAMLVRYAGFKNTYLPKDGHFEALRDDWQIADWAREYVYALQRAGIINGDDAGNGRPRANATRGESATMMYNILTR